MELAFERIGLFLQILGVMIVLLSQVRFGYKAWRKYGSLKKAFFSIVSTVRVGVDNVRNLSDEYLKKTFPEWWALAEYLSEALWITAIGLLVTLIGLFFELSNLTLTL